MRYKINFNKTINQLVPYYLGGRKLILYLQAIMSPLGKLNDAFVTYAKETRIEAAMTSQVFKLEWYLNRKFSKYFINGGRISIQSFSNIGAPIYNEVASVDVGNNMLVYSEEKGGGLVLYRSDEKKRLNSVSFVVTTPKIDTRIIEQEKYIAMMKYVIDKYRIANKTYQIKYEQK